MYICNSKKVSHKALCNFIQFVRKCTESSTYKNIEKPIYLTSKINLSPGSLGLHKLQKNLHGSLVVKIMTNYREGEQPRKNLIS